MNPELSTYRRERAVKWLVPLFIASGATSLVYQTVWERQLHLIFGTSQVAVSTVLAAFMTGLALGGFGGAKWADTVRRPVRAYAFLEAFIGIYALVFPWLVDLVQPVTPQQPSRASSACAQRPSALHGSGGSPLPCSC